MGGVMGQVINPYSENCSSLHLFSYLCYKVTQNSEKSKNSISTQKKVKTYVRSYVNLSLYIWGTWIPEHLKIEKYPLPWNFFLIFWVIIQSQSMNFTENTSLTKKSNI